MQFTPLNTSKSSDFGSAYKTFGMQLPNRYESVGDFRYGFNGMEKDDEVKNTSGSSYDFGARMYDSRLGRWLSIDPLFAKYPGESPYNFTGNSVIYLKENDGKDYVLVVDHQAKTITVKATYNVIKGDQKSIDDAKNATQYWNNKSGDFQVQFGKGKTKQIYTINFDLSVNETVSIQNEMDRPYIDFLKDSPSKKTYANSTNDGQNSFVTYDDADFKNIKTKFNSTPDADGLTSDGNSIAMPTTKDASLNSLGSSHEVGHTLGIAHFLGTVMGKNNTEIKDLVTKNLIKVIIGKAGIGEYISSGENKNAQVVLDEQNKNSNSPNILTTDAQVKIK